MKDGLPGSRGGGFDRHTTFLQERCIAQKHLATFDGGLYATSLNLLKALGFRDGAACTIGVFHKCLGKWMGRPPVRCRSQSQQFRYSHRRVTGFNTHDPGLVRSERPSLVKDHHIDLGQGLQVDASLDENARAGSPRYCSDHDQWRGESQFSRQSEDEQRDDGPHIPRDDVNDDKEDEHYRDQPRRDLVSKLLDRRLLGFCSFDEFDDARERRVIAYSLGCDIQGPAQHYRTGKHVAAAHLVARDALPGTGRLVNSCFTGLDSSVYGDFLASAYEHGVTDHDFRNGHGPLAGAATDQGQLGNRTDQGLD